MEVFINHGIFKLLGLMPIFDTADQLCKSLLSVCYSLCLISFIILQQYIIYSIQLERDFFGWFISTSVLSTSFVILVQAAVTGKGIQRLMVELMEIDSLLGGAKRTKRYFSATFYTMYCVGISRSVFRTTLMIYLGLRSPGIALQLIVPSAICLARVNLQIYLTELISSQLEAIGTELSISLEDDDRYTVDEANVTHQCRCILQRTEYLFGRLQKCLQMVNTQFGWSTAAIVVLVFIGITFQFRIPMQPMPFHGKLAVA
uniref:Gustatory receptor n=1 Tax=Anopheles funestus TaxID=62324 RepID=A0A182R5N6_ANOFN